MKIKILTALLLSSAIFSEAVVAEAATYYCDKTPGGLSDPGNYYFAGVMMQNNNGFFTPLCIYKNPGEPIFGMPMKGIRNVDIEKTHLSYFGNMWSSTEVGGVRECLTPNDAKIDPSQCGLSLAEVVPK